MPEPTSTLAEALEGLEASGDWVRFTPREVDLQPDLLLLVESFEPLEVEAGHAAAQFLKTEALENHGSTVTHLLVGEGRIEGFVATGFTDVKLSEEHSDSLGIPHRARQPAFRVVWIAKHRDTSVSGLELMAAAYGMAMSALELGGVIALVLDPADKVMAEKWKGEPYYFIESKENPSGGVPRKLWTPVDVSAV